jgi:hypothetical protein
MLYGQDADTTRDVALRVDSVEHRTNQGDADEWLVLAVDNSGSLIGEQDGPPDFDQASDLRDDRIAFLATLTALLPERTFLSTMEIRVEPRLDDITPTRDREVTLRGTVLPVGGIKDKILAAYRAGIRVVALPKANGKDLAEVPDEVKAVTTFHLLDHVDELLSIGLVGFDPPMPPPSETSGILTHPQG